MKEIIDLEAQYSATYYTPLPVIIERGEGVYVWDIENKRYLDFMSAYSAQSHGHCHPRLVKALTDQAQKLTLICRAYYSTALGPFLQSACKLTGLDKAIPMNTGAEAVETGIKASRRWAYTVKGVPDNQAEIIVCDNNFHGRTTTIVSFSSDHTSKDGFGPLTPGFVSIPFADADALAAAITPNTAAFLVEPMQGEAGMFIPPAGYLKKCAEICRENNVLLLCDEIQTGLGRTGKLFAFQHDDIKPDGLMLGKALGGGMLPVSLFLGRSDLIDVMTPHSHGSTFGGNELACNVAKTALDVLVEENLTENSARMGEYLLEKLQTLNSPLIKEVRGKGLFLGIEIDTDKVKARDLAIALMRNGLLSKETHGVVIRLAPPLIINQLQIDESFSIIQKTFRELEATNS